MSNLTHLNVYTDYSILESCIQTGDLIKKCKELGHTAIGITNQGNMFNMLEAINAGAKEGIKVIPGLEIPFEHRKGEPVSRLVLLGMNLKGYKNLMKISSLNMTRVNPEENPGLSWDEIKRHSEGVICLSGGTQSPLVKEYQRVESGEANQDWETRSKVIVEGFQKVFGDRFYIQLAYQSEIGFRKVVQRFNQIMIELAKRTKTPYVATGSCKYLNREDYDAYTSIIKMHVGMNKGGRQIPDSYWYQTREELLEMLPEEAINETNKIAERCEQIKVEREFKFPYLGAIDPDEALKHDVMRGLKLKMKETGVPRERHQEYIDRAQYELDVLKKMGFSAYIIVVADYVQWAKSEGIYVGPGRGSAAGSLICWATDITDVDSVKYGLLFERFINPERITMPDIDVDFEHISQDAVKTYIAERYGVDKVASIGTFGTMAAKGAIRDIGKAEGFSIKDRNIMAGKVPEAKRGKNAYLEDAIKDKDFKKFIEQDVKSDHGSILKPYSYLYNLAVKTEGMIRNTSTHAAGVVISDNKPLTDYLPLYLDDNGKIVTQYGMDLVEKIGLIKFDILALKTLTTIRRTVEAIQKTKGDRINIRTIPMDDPRVYDLLCSGDLPGIFQLGGSSGFRELTINIQPRFIEEVTDITSIYRPGPLDNGFDKIYIENKHSGKYKPQIVVPGKEKELNEILRPTKGVIIYQEQVMKLAQVLAGFNLAQADLLRRAMGKKDEEKMAAEKEGFISGCVKNGVDKARAEEVFDILAKFAEYGFNKSHALAYSIMTYQTAWLKTHYNIEYMTACLTEEIGKDKETRILLGNCRSKGIELLVPDVNRSAVGFAAEEDGIRFGLGSIKGLGNVTEEIISARSEKGNFRNLYDFCGKVNTRKVNKKSLELLIKAGAFDNIL